MKSISIKSKKNKPLIKRDVFAIKKIKVEEND
jgi:hypothetical protein